MGVHPLTSHPSKRRHPPLLVDCTAALIASPLMELNLSLGVKTAVTVKIATLVLAAPKLPGGFHMMTFSSLSVCWDKVCV